jgi:hypothetical protein
MRPGDCIDASAVRPGDVLVLHRTEGGTDAQASTGWAVTRGPSLCLELKGDGEQERLSRCPSKMLLTPEQPSELRKLKPEYHSARSLGLGRGAGPPISLLLSAAVRPM